MCIFHTSMILCAHMIGVYFSPKLATFFVRYYTPMQFLQSHILIHRVKYNKENALWLILYHACINMKLCSECNPKVFVIFLVMLSCSSFI